MKRISFLLVALTFCAPPALRAQDAATAFPQARAWKESGAYVIGVVGFRNRDLMFWEDKFRGVCDELIVCTDDGSYGRPGFVTAATGVAACIAIIRGLGGNRRRGAGGAGAAAGRVRLGVGDRIDAALDVSDVTLFEAAQDVDNGVCLLDIGQEFVPSFCLAASFCEPRDIDYFHSSMYNSVCNLMFFKLI